MNKMIASPPFAARFYQCAMGKLTGGTTIKEDLIVQAKNFFLQQATVKECLTVQTTWKLQVAAVVKENLIPVADDKSGCISKAGATCKSYLQVQREEAQ
ncbi:hypothetical protein [Collimonas silvisoli]|uniref:hypothetical protein n=1 Tax=Collimonas silvisoli TaxID=2825884 RepID=UPI001B8A9AF2|nr:hypothetical protein [Collimonas silvisoli]